MSQVQSGPGRNINKKIQLFQVLLLSFWTMGDVCSALVLAQNEHSKVQTSISA